MIWFQLILIFKENLFSQETKVLNGIVLPDIVSCILKFGFAFIYSDMSSPVATWLYPIHSIMIINPHISQGTSQTENLLWNEKVKYDLRIANVIDSNNLHVKVLDKASDYVTIFWTACFADFYA